MSNYKINQIAESVINGQWSQAKQQASKISFVKLLDGLIAEGFGHEEALRVAKKLKNKE